MSNERTGAPLRVGRQGAGKSVAELIERAFHYRGDVTIRLDNGDSVTGYLFNRNNRVSEPFAQLFETRTGREICISYQNIAEVLLTGRDAAATSLKHFEDFQERQEESARLDSDSS